MLQILPRAHLFLSEPEAEKVHPGPRRYRYCSANTVAPLGGLGAGLGDERDAVESPGVLVCVRVCFVVFCVEKRVRRMRK